VVYKTNRNLRANHRFRQDRDRSVKTDLHQRNPRGRRLTISPIFCSFPRLCVSQIGQNALYRSIDHTVPVLLEKYPLPTRSAALEQLDQFSPLAGFEYQKWRNYDFGQHRHTRVSGLSPYIRIGLLNEVECARAVLAKLSEAQCRKFLEELFWRVYWKGYLENHPAIWDQYQCDLDSILTIESPKRKIDAAESGQTGIDCFDSWAAELVETGYLHNHARMWFASIWIFTLKLPWQAGAHFFLSHLLDGDAATNTLSWRWVAGLHTKGKTYLARSANIAKYTEKRFSPTGLASQAAPLAEESFPLSPHPQAGPFTVCHGSAYGYLFTDDDVSIPDFGDKRPSSALALFPEARYARASASQKVATFRRASMEDTVKRLENQGIPTALVCRNHKDAVGDWIIQNQFDTIVSPQPYVGDWNNDWPEIDASIGAHGATLRLFRRWWEAELFPRAKKGFFNLKKHLPTVSARIRAYKESDPLL